ncbi:MAG: NADH-quinone oxidoreductase subunit J [Acidimicrobiia bacterium]|nr:NADH-quinone oxidoreductase subunit J [Acidimicrobiia bacterium]
MIAQNVVFWILAVAMVLAAIGVVRSNNLVHAALYLVVVLAGSAAQFILLAAEFVAWVQVLIYIGAVIILFLFGIMLTRAPMREDLALDNDQRLAAAVVSLFLLGVLSTLLIQAFGDSKIDITGPQGSELVNNGRAGTLAESIFSTYVLPFELVSILLLASLIGAVVLARRD